MSKKKFCFSTPVKFAPDTLKELRESALRNQRSLSGEVRYRILQTLAVDADRESGSATNETSAIRNKSKGGL